MWTVTSRTFSRGQAQVDSRTASDTCSRWVISRNSAKPPQLNRESDWDRCDFAGRSNASSLLRMVDHHQRYVPKKLSIAKPNTTRHCVRFCACVARDFGKQLGHAGDFVVQRRTAWQYRYNLRENVACLRETGSCRNRQ